MRNQPHRPLFVSRNQGKASVSAVVVLSDGREKPVQSSRSNKSKFFLYRCESSTHCPGKPSNPAAGKPTALDSSDNNDPVENLFCSISHQEKPALRQLIKNNCLKPAFAETYQPIAQTSRCTHGCSQVSRAGPPGTVKHLAGNVLSSSPNSEVRKNKVLSLEGKISPCILCLPKPSDHCSHSR